MTYLPNPPTSSPVEQSILESQPFSSNASNSQRSTLSIIIPQLNDTQTQTLSSPLSIFPSSPKSSSLSSLLPLLESNFFSPSPLFSPSSFASDTDELKEALLSLAVIEEEELQRELHRNASFCSSCSTLVDTSKVNATTQTCASIGLSEEDKNQMSEDLVYYAEGALFGLDGQVADEGKAFRLLCLAAERYSCPHALALVGFCHEFGLGTPQDFAKCEQPYLAAAEHRQPLAMTRLSFLKRYGRPYVKMNRVEANYWQQELLRLNESYLATLKLNKIHKQEFDDPLAQTPVAWLWWASEICQHPAAQYSLGTCFHDGVGIEKNPENAVHWYHKSAAQNHPRGQGILGYCYGEGFGIRQDEKMALHWYLKAAAQGETVAMYNVGYCYEEGIGLAKDYSQAFVWYHRAATKGNGLAANSLGYFYEEGLGVAKNLSQAVHWYSLAAQWGNPWAEHNLGYLYSMGLGVTKNLETAFYWFHKAALQGHAGAQNRVGQCYQLGQGVELNLSKAVEWYRLAAQQYHGPACVNLAWCLEHSVGTSRNFPLALQYIDRAIQIQYESSHGIPLVDWAIHIALRVDLEKLYETANEEMEAFGAPTASMA